MLCLIHFTTYVISCLCEAFVNFFILDASTDHVRWVNLLHVAMQVRGPLVALRTLGSILVPRLRQKEGQEIDRDVAQGILTQACILAIIICLAQS